MRSMRHISLAAVAALAGGLVVLPAGSASATNPGSKKGNQTTGCEVRWAAASIQDPDEGDMPADLRHYNEKSGNYEYSNSGFAQEVNNVVHRDPGFFEIQHYLVGSGDAATVNWRLPIGTDKTILGAKLTLQLPAGYEYTVTGAGDLAAFAARHSGEKGYTFKPVDNVVIKGDTATIDLGTLPAKGGAMLQISQRVGADRASDTFEASAVLTGSYIEGAGCDAAEPPARTDAPPLQPCQIALTGRSIRGITAPDVEARIKDDELPGEVNADSWAGHTNADSWTTENGRTEWRLYAASDIDLTDVTYTVKAVQGLTFGENVTFASPGGGALGKVNEHGKSYPGAVSGEGKVVRSADGKTLTVTVKHMPAKSSFSLNVAGIPDGSGKKAVIDEVLVGTATRCTEGAPAAKVDTDTREGSPDCATKTVPITTVTTITRYVFDPRTGRFVAAEPQRITTTSSRSLSSAEAKACAPVVTPPAPENPKPGHPKPEQPKPEHPKPEQPKPGTPTPERPTPPDLTRPDMTKPGTPPKRPRMVTRTFQVDRYMPRTAAQARLVARLARDGRLRYREDRPMWGAARWQFVTVTVPANATRAQVMKAINAKTSTRIGDVRTTSRLATMRPGRAVVVAWELGKGATTKAAWGPKKNVNQTFFARS